MERLVLLSLTNILSHYEHKELDNRATSINKILPLSLMEEAASYIFYDLKKRFALNREKIAIICGTGNNGGDGLSLARKFLAYNIHIDIYLFSNKEGSELYEYQKNIIETLGIDFKPLESLQKNINNYSIIIDSIFGIGFDRTRLNSEIIDLFTLINNSNKMVISIDTPSGMGNLSSETEISDNSIISANITYSLGFYKDSFFNILNRKFVGEIKNIKLSFFIANIDKENNFFYINKRNYRINKRDNKDSKINIEQKNQNFVNKYSKGGAIFIGGSLGMVGSIVMASTASIRVGSGISLILTEEECIPLISVLRKELVVDKIYDYRKHIKKYETICIGPGLKLDDKAKNVLKEIFLEKKQFILDASFFTTFDKSILYNFSIPPILTPHTGEFIRFFGDEASDIKTDTLKTATHISKKYNSYIILKDSFLTIATPKGDGYIYDNPNRLLAQAGSGDILAGTISGVISQKSSINLLDEIFKAVELFYSVARFLKKRKYKSYDPDLFLKLLSLL
jgi:NAD(P)H-hydrate epimerase